jgi:hypothetical protein
MIPDSVVEAWKAAWFNNGGPPVPVHAMIAALEAAAPLLKEQWINDMAQAIAQANDAVWRSAHTKIHCSACGEWIAKGEVDVDNGHCRIGYDSKGAPEQIHCGPVIPPLPQPPKESP